MKKLNNRAFTLLLATIFSVSNPAVVNLRTLEAQSDKEIALVPQLGHVAFYLNAGVSSVAISPDKKLIVTGGGDGSIKFWDLSTGLLSRSILAHVGGVNAVLFSPDGRLIASGGGDKRVRLWEVRTGHLTRTLEGHETGIMCLAFSVNGVLIASGSGSYADVGVVSDNTVRIWNVQTGLLKTVLRGHRQQITNIAFNGEGNRLASGSFDKTVIVWSTDTGRLLRTINTEATDSISWSPDGNRIASAAAQRIIFWNVDSGMQVGGINYPSHTSKVAFTPDWRLVAIREDLWDVTTGIKIRSVADG